MKIVTLARPALALLGSALVLLPIGCSSSSSSSPTPPGGQNATCATVEAGNWEFRFGRGGGNTLRGSLTQSACTVTFEGTDTFTGQSTTTYTGTLTERTWEAMDSNGSLAFSGTFDEEGKAFTGSRPGGTTLGSEVNGSVSANLPVSCNDLAAGEWQFTLQFDGSTSIQEQTTGRSDLGVMSCQWGARWPTLPGQTGPTVDVSLTLDGANLTGTYSSSTEIQGLGTIATAVDLTGTVSSETMFSGSFTGSSNILNGTTGPVTGTFTAVKL